MLWPRAARPAAQSSSSWIQVLLVAPPLYPEFYARVRPEVHLFRSAIEGLAAEHGAVFADLTDPRRSDLTEGSFRDVVQMHERAAARFSRQVARVIRSLFAAGSGSSELQRRGRT